VTSAKNACIRFLSLLTLRATAQRPFSFPLLIGLQRLRSSWIRSRISALESVLGSNYVSKPTAGDGLQSFRLLPAGSGLTRR
jgi:hypothetical protein